MELISPISVTLPYYIMDVQASTSSYCGGCVPPPEFHLPPPPDPSMIFNFDDGERVQFEQWLLDASCTGEDGSPIFVEDQGGRGESLFPAQQYFIYIIGAIGSMFFIAILLAFAMLWLQRRGKCCVWLSPFKTSESKESHSDSSANSSHKLTSSRSSKGPGNTHSTQWTHDTLNSYQRPSLHQANSVGVLMYGGGSSRDVHRSRVALPPTVSCRTLPPKDDWSPDENYSRNPQVFRAMMHSPNSSRIYEEIAYKNCGIQDYDACTGSNEYCASYSSSPRNQRLPPPRSRPPPPPAPFTHTLESPISQSSCEVRSGDSTSLEHEIDQIQITPSPKRRYPTNPGGRILPVQRYQPNMLQDADEISSSPETSTGTREDPDCTSASGGRESGYGTEGRHNRVHNNTFSPHLHRGSKRPSRETDLVPRTLPNCRVPPSSPQNMWVVSTSNRDPPQLSATTTPIHAMTYV